MVTRIVIGLVVTVVALAVAGRRMQWLQQLAFSGQPAPERVAQVRSHPSQDAEIRRFRWWGSASC